LGISLGTKLAERSEPVATTSTRIKIEKKPTAKILTARRRKKTVADEDDVLREAKALQQFKDLLLKYAGKASFEGYVD
jgi:hypothetical protein